jgi:hypothetical protein
VRPFFLRTISEAFSRSTKCFVTAGNVIASGAASSLTGASPSAKRARTARRVGSAKAKKVRSSESVYRFTIWYSVIHDEAVVNQRPWHAAYRPGIRFRPPILLYFVIRWFPRAPRQTLYVLALQIGVALAALAPVYLLGL